MSRAPTLLRGLGSGDHTRQVESSQPRGVADDVDLDDAATDHGVSHDRKRLVALEQHRSGEPLTSAWSSVRPS